MRTNRPVSNHESEDSVKVRDVLLSGLVKHSDAHVRESRGKAAHGRDDRWMRFFQTLN